MWVHRKLALVMVLPIVLELTAAARGASIEAWGYDNFGEVSNVPAGNDFVAITGNLGYNGYALRSDGSIAAWGSDLHQQVSGAPTGTGFTAIAATGHNAFALKTDGSIVAWGNDDTYGEISGVP